MALHVIIEIGGGDKRFTTEFAHEARRFSVNLSDMIRQLVAGSESITKQQDQTMIFGDHMQLHRSFIYISNLQLPQM